ncbi:hypothetical protein GCM10023340_08300 [Nocardioides marinquilinus]|uniref:DUF222 domain-containing protein n=1 Tax=Nocardioides marinquilinus TaxID=1210400 RepID=A0ABP9PF56_9ACTN
MGRSEGAAAFARLRERLVEAGHAEVWSTAGIVAEWLADERDQRRSSDQDETTAKAPTSGDTDRTLMLAGKAVHAARWHDADGGCDDPSGCGASVDDEKAARAVLDVLQDPLIEVDAAVGWSFRVSPIAEGLKAIETRALAVHPRLGAVCGRPMSTDPADDDVCLLAPDHSGNCS